MLIKKNKRCIELCRKVIKDNISTSSYSYNYQYSGGGVKKFIYFYEWSTVNGTTKTFHSEKEFCDFLKLYNISCTEEHKKIIRTNQWCYASCVPGKRILIVSPTYLNLKDELNAQANSNTCTALAVCK